MAVDASKKLIDRAMQPKTSKKKVQDIMSKYTANQIKGSAVAIQDLVKRLNKSWAGLKEIKKNKKIVLKMISEILRFCEKPVVDESIQEYEYHEYKQQARTNLNSAGGDKH